MTAKAFSVSIIVSAFDFGRTLEECISRIEDVAPPGAEVLIVTNHGTQARTRFDETDARRLWKAKNFTMVGNLDGNYARGLNRAVRLSRGGVLIFIPSFVDVGPELIPRYVEKLKSDPHIAMAYGNYDIVISTGERVTQTIIADEADLSEWSSVGYVKAIRRSSFEAIGGFDPSYNWADEYDLRLRITQCFTLGRISDPLYEIDLPSVQLDQKEQGASIQRYFTPESSPRKGFGYLFSSEKISQEINRAFNSALHKRKAYLTHENRPIQCPHFNCEPIVSVIIPVHNRVHLIGRAIESVLAGSFKQFELIVVDNGSTDGTVEKVEHFQRKFPNIMLLRSPPRQISAALNLGVHAARGKYISQLDSDDEYTPETLEMQVSHLESHPRCALAISYYDVIDQGGNPLPELGTIKHLEYDRNNILRTNGAGAARTWHRCVIESLGGFDEQNFGNYAEDYDLVLRVSEQHDVDRVHAVLYRCRLHGGNTEQGLSMEFRASKKIFARSLALERRQKTTQGVALTFHQATG